MDQLIWIMKWHRRRMKFYEKSFTGGKPVIIKELVDVSIGVELFYVHDIID